MSTPIAVTATTVVSVSILGVRPGDSRQFPARGTPVDWTWRWLGDVPDVLGANLLHDYTAAIAFLNFTFFFVWAIAVRWALGPARRAAAFSAIVLLPLCLEMAQLYPFGGTPAMTDAWTNILGGMTGLLVWEAATRFTAARRHPLN
ncbi:VanZ family protein [Demequina sp.]|uniref:VanZ family protein n=1 Tax=Demequina sp. TaxID=2050685 RepID=UPI003A87A70E